MRGLDFTERDAATIPEAELYRIDICWSVAAGLGVVDLIRGAEFQSRHVLFALRAGEDYRVARAMAFETVQTATRGGRRLPGRGSWQNKLKSWRGAQDIHTRSAWRFGRADSAPT